MTSGLNYRVLKFAVKNIILVKIEIYLLEIKVKSTLWLFGKYCYGSKCEMIYEYIIAFTYPCSMIMSNMTNIVLCMWNCISNEIC